MERIKKVTLYIKNTALRYFEQYFGMARGCHQCDHNLTELNRFRDMHMAI